MKMKNETKIGILSGSSPIRYVNVDEQCLVRGISFAHPSKYFLRCELNCNIDFFSFQWKPFHASVPSKIRKKKSIPSFHQQLALYAITQKNDCTKEPMRSPLSVHIISFYSRLIWSGSERNKIRDTSIQIASIRTTALLHVVLVAVFCRNRKIRIQISSVLATHSHITRLH